MANTKLIRTPSSASNRKKFTISLWFKIGRHPFTDGAGGDSRELIGQTSSSYFRFMIQSSGTIRFYDQSGFNYITNRKFRDKSAWYHATLRVDTTQSTANDRVRLYINGVDERTVGGYSTDSKPSQNQDFAWNITAVHQVGGHSNNYDYFSGVMSDVVQVDGQSLAPTSFGETDPDTGEWRIKDLTSSSFTWGTNGFMILHNGNTITDQSSNSNNFSLQSGTLTKTEDTPSNNFATMNPLIPSQTNYTYSHGNTTITQGSASWVKSNSTLGMTSGKYYWEAKYVSGLYTVVGVDKTDTATPYPSTSTSAVGWKRNGNVEVATTPQTDIATYAHGDIVSIALDMDNNCVYFGKGGVWQNSGNPTSGSSKTGAYSLPIANSTYFATVSPYSGGATSMNFGNGYFGTTAVASAGTNASGNGIFEYDVPTGYTALSTKGLNI